MSALGILLGVLLVALSIQVRWPFDWNPGPFANSKHNPGLMFTAGAVYHVLHFFNITIDIRNVCVLLAPWFASNTAIVTYFFTKEVYNKSAGLIAAAMIAIVPGDYGSLTSTSPRTTPSNCHIF